MVTVTRQHHDHDIPPSLGHSGSIFPPHIHISFFPISDMTDHSGSTRFRSLFESAFREYEKKMSITLAEHPLAIQLQSCHSIESTAGVLQGQAQAFSKFRGSDRVIKSIKGTLSILTTLSDTATLGDSVGLVRQKLLTTCPAALTALYSHFHLRRRYTLVSPSFSTYVPSPVPI